MQREIRLLALVVAMTLLLGTAAWADDFYVIAGGGSALGTKITSVPYTISNPGFYYLTGNLTFNGGGNAITVSADNVTLDLMGFSLTNVLKIGVTYGIYMQGRANVEIRNGTVSNFTYGINETGGDNHRVNNVRALNNGSGISLNGNSHVVQGCTVSNNAGDGLFVNSGVIINCVAYNNSSGISLFETGSVINNIANNNKTYNFHFGWDVNLPMKVNIVADHNSAAGLNPNYFSATGVTGIIWGLNAGSP